RKIKNPKKKSDENSNDEPSISSGEQTFRLYKQGLDLNEIAEQRGISLGTVERHLVRFISSGEVDIDALVSPEKQGIINKVLHSVEEGTGLGIIKSMLPESVSFRDITYVLA